MILISLDSKGKIRVVEVLQEWSEDEGAYVIRRFTYQYMGKVTTQPLLTIKQGKAKRTLLEQVTLEFNAIVRGYKDKGYKELPKYIDINNRVGIDTFIEENFAEGKTDGNGFPKHMLAKQADKVATSAFDKLKYWYASRKIDGVRNSFFLKDGEIRSASRGGKHYDFATSHIRNHPLFMKLFEKYPNIKLDGELYKQGKSLQVISGAARLEASNERNNWLEYYIYDVMDESMNFEDRLDVLEEIKEILNLKFEPNKPFQEGELQIRMVPHEKVSGWSAINTLHDKYVNEGWEGVVIRDPNKPYKFGARGNQMIKVKKYKDDVFKVVGIEQGLRLYDDMCFVCETKAGNRFNAKPMGDTIIKTDYTINFESEYLNKFGECKFFYYSDGGEENGVPLQPTFKCFREDFE